MPSERSQLAQSGNLMKPRILIVEDDAALAELLVWNFKGEGYDVRQTGDGEEALLMVQEDIPDAIVLDWMIENVPGIEVCRRLRKNQETASIPVIILTARGEEEDRIRGLKTGADDYVTKPFSPRELLARVEALLRRSRPSIGGATLKFADLELDPVAHRVRRAGSVVPIGPTEFRLLRHFMERPGRVYSREQLLDAVWGMDSNVELRTVDVHIRRLRKAINPGDTPDVIRTVRSAGYSMDAPE
jgi:two-component system, OmpR family, phosphate regulon response regulator PhoB